MCRPDDFPPYDDTHPFDHVGGCMSRCRCGRTYSDPVHGEQPENIKRLREAVMAEITYPRTQHGLECPSCHDRIFSNSRHDFVECSCKLLFIDGGFDYTRWGGQAAVSAIKIERVLETRPPAYFAQEKHA
jgi:hypothetical protein